MSSLTSWLWHRNHYWLFLSGFWRQESFCHHWFHICIQTPICLAIAKYGTVSYRPETTTPLGYWAPIRTAEKWKNLYSFLLKDIAEGTHSFWEKQFEPHWRIHRGGKAWVVFLLRCEMQNPSQVFLTARTFRTWQHIYTFSVTVKAWSHTAALCKTTFRSINHKKN